MMAKTAKITEMMNTAVVGGERFISSPPSCRRADCNRFR